MKEGRLERKYFLITGDCHMRVIERTRQSFFSFNEEDGWVRHYLSKMTIEDVMAGD